MVIGKNSSLYVEIASPTKKVFPSGNRTKKEAMDALTSIAITTAVVSSGTNK